MWSDPLLLAVFEHFPPRATIFKDSPGRPKEEFELETTRPFHHWFGLAADELFGGRDVLDLGSGFGGSAVWFERYGARSVVGVEVEEDKVAYAAEFASRVGAENVAFVRGRGEALPFAANSFDLITMYDVLEHVVSPRATLDECWRVLRPGGLLATVFPPYYDILGARTFTATPRVFRASTSCLRHGSSAPPARSCYSAKASITSGTSAPNPATSYGTRTA